LGLGALTRSLNPESRPIEIQHGPIRQPEVEYSIVEKKKDIKMIRNI
jgi:hypothetical protein